MLFIDMYSTCTVFVQLREARLYFYPSTICRFMSLDTPVIKRFSL